MSKPPIGPAPDWPVAVPTSPPIGLDFCLSSHSARISGSTGWRIVWLAETGRSRRVLRAGLEAVTLREQRERGGELTVVDEIGHAEKDTHADQAE